MASSNHGCCYSSVTVNHHSMARTPALHMAYMPPPVHTLLSYEAVPSWPELDDSFFLFNHGDSIAEVEMLPTVEKSEEELWIEAVLNHSVPDLSLEETNMCLGTCSDYDKSIDSSGDLSSGSGTVLNKIDFSSFSAPLSPTISFNSQFQPESSFSPLPTTSTNTHATQNQQQQQQQEVVMFIVKGDGDALYDGYSWRKYGEKSIKHRAYRRRYYRCGHTGCKVKKQAEQSMENPLEFHITYYGRHNHSAITDFSSIGYNQMAYQISYPNL